MRQLSLLISLGLGASACFSVRAQSAPFAAPANGDLLMAQAPTRALKEVVISGTRDEQSRDELPMSVDVLSAQDMEEAQVRDIRDAVKNLPNVSVKRSPARFGLVGGSSDGRSGNEGFNIRGLDGNRVLLLVDGIRAPRSYVFSSYSFGRDSFSTDLLKRIEVVRGPASVLYGSDGLAGLVNFITHEPADFLAAGQSVGGRASTSYDSDTQGVGVSSTVAGQLNESAQWLLSASHYQGKEQDNMGTNDAANVDRTRPNPQTDRANALLAKLVLRPTAQQKHVVTFEHVEKKSEFDMLTSRSKAPLVATSVVRGDALSTSERQRMTWAGRYQLNQPWVDNLQTVLSYQQSGSRQYTLEDRNTAPDRVRDMTYKERTWQASVQADKTWQLAPDWAHKITAGIDYAQAKVVNLQTGLTPATGEVLPLKRFPDTTDTNAAFYLQDEFMGERWSITPGVRVDRFKLAASQAGYAALPSSLSGSAVSPKLGLLYRASPEWSVFGNYASGFRAPNASQLNGFFENVNAFYKTVANPNLKPEKSQNLEFGVRGRLRNVSIDVAAFTGKFNNLIEDNVTVGGAGVPGNPTVFQSVNIGRAAISGFEIKGQVDWGMVAGGQLSMPFSYGQARGTDKTSGRALNSVDPSKLHLGLKYATAAWDIRLDANHHAAKSSSDAFPTAQFMAPAATTLNLGGQWRINPKLRVNVAINNLTNKKYWSWSDVRGLAATSRVADAYTQPGRALSVSLVADF